MYKILYDTNTYFQKQVGEEFYCKSLVSVKRVLRQELKKDVENGTIKRETEKEVIKKFDVWNLNCKTLWNAGDLQIDCETEEFYIWIEKIVVL